ncbi:glycosyltransferase [Desulfurispirillum indicum]|uniref:glycosyltransferase n=1 Tax=Desulfurispirillum indicum TaxID=936456 RepID=UPI001CFBD4CC|nr:glycosyltransferase [Desulfurispirillum indicum]UCZ56222.1 glycosyltransferase [Desulfurispirillum indicum]
MVKVDLHLHSAASSRGAGFFSEKLQIQESYITPRQVYDTLFERGMNLFTITDHDSIDGCLEIAHLPGAFLSEEVTAYFPEDRCKIHVIALDINEEIHREIQRLRYNVYELVDYLQGREVESILAHPLYDMDGKLRREHIERCLLLFDNWEMINGTRSRLSSGLTEEIVATVEGHDLELLANRYGFNRRRRERIAFTGGSDDHAGMDIGTTYTSCEGETLADLKDALRAGTTEPQGNHGSPMRLTHMIMSIAYQWGKARSGSEGVLFEHLLGIQKPSFLQRMLGSRKVEDYIARIAGIHPGEESRRHEMMHSFFKNFLPHTVRQFSEVRDFDFEKISSLVGKTVLSSVPTLFYTSTCWQRAVEKRRSRQIACAFGVGRKHSEGKIAYFTDTLREINGVALTSRKLMAIAREENFHMTFITAYSGQDSDEFHRNFEPIFSFALPEYEDLTVNIPHFLEMLEYVDAENFDVIYAATPGVVGLYAFIIAKILNIPYVTTFHTDLPAYIRDYTGDHLFTRNLWSAFALLFNNSARVLAPSREYGRILKAHGVKRKRIEVFSRGVNHERFNPEFREPSFWSRFDPQCDGRKIVLFVGRIAVEKNIDIFMQASQLLQNRDDVRFVVVGDGPYRRELEAKYAHNVLFVGFLEGRDLSTAFASADIFLFPSMTETFGNVILEAQASGLPAIVSAEGATRENLRPGSTGFVIEDNNPFSYAAKVQELLESPALLEKMRQEAIRHMADKGERDLLIQMIDLLSLGKVRQRRPIEGDALVVSS